MVTMMMIIIIIIVYWAVSPAGVLRNHINKYIRYNNMIGVQSV